MANNLKPIIHYLSIMVIVHPLIVRIFSISFEAENEIRQSGREQEHIFFKVVPLGICKPAVFRAPILKYTHLLDFFIDEVFFEF